MKKKIFVFLFNGFSDWEISFLTPEINKSKDLDLIYFSKDGNIISSMGGLKIIPDFSFSELNYSEIDMLILPGGSVWETEQDKELMQLTKHIAERGKYIAAICAATIFLGHIGLLNKIKHTSNDLNYLKGAVPQYCGEKNYQNSLSVTDKNIITASGVAPIEFAREIFKKVNLYSDRDIEKWFQLFKNGIWSQ